MVIFSSYFITASTKHSGSIFDTICRPAFTYFIIATIVCIITLLFNYAQVGLADLCSQLVTITSCTLILMGLCKFREELSWVFTTFFVICSLIWSYATFEHIFINFLN